MTKLFNQLLILTAKEYLRGISFIEMPRIDSLLNFSHRTVLIHDATNYDINQYQKRIKVKVLKREFSLLLQNVMDHENVRVLWFRKSNETTRISHSSISSYLFAPMCIPFPHKRSLSLVIYFYLVRGKLTFVLVHPPAIYLRIRQTSGCPVSLIDRRYPRCREHLSEFWEVRRVLEAIGSVPGDAWTANFFVAHRDRFATNNWSDHKWHSGFISLCNKFLKL